MIMLPAFATASQSMPHLALNPRLRCAGGAHSEVQVAFDRLAGLGHGLVDSQLYGNPPIYSCNQKWKLSRKGQSLFRGDASQGHVRPFVIVGPQPACREVLDLAN